MLSRVLPVAAAYFATGAWACSMMHPIGVQMARLGPDPNAAEGANHVKVLLHNYDSNGMLLETAQVVVDFDDGSMAVLPDSADFPEVPTGFVDDVVTDVAVDVLRGLVNVTWTASGSHQEASAAFPVADAAEAVAWYSASLAHMFILYRTADYTTRTAACSIPSPHLPVPQCGMAAAPAMGVIDFFTGKAKVWDAAEMVQSESLNEGLVGLPLMCCVCTSHTFFTYQILESLPPQVSLHAVPALDALGPTWIDPVDKTVWSAEFGSTGYSDALTITRYSLEDHTQTQVSLGAAPLADVFLSSSPPPPPTPPHAGQGAAPPGKGMPAWSVAVVALAAAAIGAASMYLFNKRQRRTPTVNAGTDLSKSLNTVPLSSSTAAVGPAHVTPQVALVGQQG